MLLGPVAQMIDADASVSPSGVIEYSTVTGTVAIARRLHQPVALQALQHLRQHLLRNAVDGAAQLVEAQRLVAQQQQDQYRPFVADPVEDLAGRAVRRIGIGLHRLLRRDQVILKVRS